MDREDTMVLPGLVGDEEETMGLPGLGGGGMKKTPWVSQAWRVDGEETMGLPGLVGGWGRGHGSPDLVGKMEWVLGY